MNIEGRFSFYINISMPYTQQATILPCCGDQVNQGNKDREKEFTKSNFVQKSHDHI